MAVTSNTYTGNGSTTTYSFTFPYLAQTDVKAKINGTTQNTTEYTFPTATTLQFNTAPSNGAAILIFRDTDNSTRQATFYAGSSIKASDLNDNFDQILYTAQEVDENALSSQGDDPMQADLSMGNNKLTNLGTPTAGTDAVNKTYVDTNTWDTGAETYTSSETWTGNNTTIATSGAIDARIDSKVDTAIEGDVLVGTDLSKSASSGQVTINHNVTGANSTVNNSNGNVLQDITVTAQGHVTSVGSTNLDDRYYTETEIDANFYKLGSAGEIASGEAWSASDTKIATTAAIDARIIDLVDDVGGFVAIDNEQAFPNANPDINNSSGTIVSIKALGSNLTSNGSGEATITNGTVGNSTVTITGLANNTLYTAGYGMLVGTTPTLHRYIFHRLTPKATEVTTVASNISNINSVANNATNINTVASQSSNISTIAGNNTNITTVAGISSNVTSVAGNSTNINAVNSNSSNINTVAGSISNVNTTAGSIANVNTVATNISSVNDFSDLYRISSSDPTSHLHTGDLVFNTTSNELRVYNGSAWQGGVTATGNLLPASGGQMTGNLTFSGSQTVDGRDVSVDGTKLDGIESGATADMTGAQIKTAYEGESDTNAYTDAEKTKLSGIAASADQNVQSDWNATSGDAVILNKPTIPSAYTHPNHSGEVTSTGDGATVIADDVVDEANLKVSNAPTNGYVLTAQSGNTGGLTWAEAAGGGGTTWGSYNLYSEATSGLGYPNAGNAGQGFANISLGISAGANISGNSARHNVFIGKDAGLGLDAPENNVVIGHDTMEGADGDVDMCIAIGYQALYSVDASASSSDGKSNIAIGEEAASGLSTGSNNTIIGRWAAKGASALSTGSNNLILGNMAGAAGSPSGNIGTSSNVICLGDGSITDLYCNDTSISSSDKRDKTDVTDFTHGLKWVEQLKPVTYRWDKRSWYSDDLSVTPNGSKKTARQHIGFLAQDVLAIEQADGFASKKDDMLVVNINEDSTAYGLKYERLVPVLVNAIKELSAKVKALEAK